MGIYFYEKAVGSVPIYETSTSGAAGLCACDNMLLKFLQKGVKTATPMSQPQTSILLQWIVVKALDKDTTVGT